MGNRLANESSPYLLQHADNPVDWYPWGAEAFERARAEDKPVLLSVGYAACHWCHVMAHESFEDETTAAYMNAHYINVKVDREERPDIDGIYMSAVQAMTQQGGWPMTVVMTPAGEPFFGGTYFPPSPRYSMPSFMQVLQSVNQAWRDRRGELEESATEIANHIQRAFDMTGRPGAINDKVLREAITGFARSFDRERGGFGRAPKFPQPMGIEYLLRAFLRFDDPQALTMAETTLQKMAFGGMYDQLGGGFARYSTDNDWLVPHFEKMLYDNAQLARVYLHAYQITSNPLYRRVVEETLDYVIREMRHVDGGFYSSQDADSEGVEGKFYVWQPHEIEAELEPEEATLFKRYYDVTLGGNWEGNSILNVKSPPAQFAAAANMSEAELLNRLEAARIKLYGVRSKRIWPGLDDKILTAWNGLMLATFAEAGRVLNRPDYTQTATANAQFLYRTMRRDNGRLLRTWKAGGTAKYNAYLEDYAYLADGLLALYQSTFDAQWYEWARELAELMITRFSDHEKGGFFDTSDDHEALLYRPKDVQDNAVPSGNAMAAKVMATLTLFSGEGQLWERAEGAVSSIAAALAQYPTAFGEWLSAAWLLTANPVEIAIVADPGSDVSEQMLAVVAERYRPDAVVALGGEGDSVPLLKQRVRLDDQATAYVCRRFVCQRPVTEPDALRQQLAGVVD